MTPSKNCTDLVKEFEGCKLEAYKCPAGVNTIGYGHTSGVQMGDVCTQGQADQWLDDELIKFGKQVEAVVTAPINQQMFDALVSFTYNLGIGNLKDSTLLKYLNQGLYKDAADQFPRWNKSKGQELPGLTRRRAAERALFLSDGTNV